MLKTLKKHNRLNNTILKSVKKTLSLFIVFFLMFIATVSVANSKPLDTLSFSIESIHIDNSFDVCYFYEEIAI